MEILLALISMLFWPALIIALIIWLVKKASSRPNTEYIVEGTEFKPANYTNDELAIRAKIATEIRAQAGQYQTPAQKKIVEEMAQTVEYFATHSYTTKQTITQALSSVNVEFVPAGSVPNVSKATQISPMVKTELSIESVPYETPWKKMQLLDGATILLYLGAFFLLASIGLYVALGQGGAIKALLVTLITLLFYGAGIALYKNSARLKPAGLTFAAIGMATLPMAGAAIYYFALDEQNGPAVWLITSITAIILYAHALYVLKSTLVSYMVVFSTLSVVLASISSLGLAPYYFIQGMCLAGLLFAIGSRLANKNDPILATAYDRSAMFLVPFSLGTAVLLVSQIGWRQLALSLLLTATYYGYMALATEKNRRLYVLTSQVVGIASLLVGAYGYNEMATSVALTAGLLSLIYVGIWLTWAQKRIAGDTYRTQIKYILLSLPFIASAALLWNPQLLWFSVSLTLIISLLVYVSDHCWVSGFSWLLNALILPLCVAYFTLSSDPSASTIGFVYLILGVLSLVLSYLTRLRGVVSEKVLFLLLMVISQMLVFCFQLTAPNRIQTIAGISQILLLTLWAFVQNKKAFWLGVTAVVQALWLSLLVDSPEYLFAGIISIACFNLIVAQIRFSSVLHDWFVAVSVLVAPLAWGVGIASPRWGVAPYWLSYVAIAIALILLRFAQKILHPVVSSTIYFTALGAVYILGYFISPWFGFASSLGCVLVLLLSEKLESNSVPGYVAMLLPLGLLFHSGATSRQNLLALAVTTTISLLCTVWRKRRYEAYISMIGSIAALWTAGVLVYDWSSVVLMVSYFALTALFIVLRLLLRNKKSTFADVLMVGYSLALGFSLTYALVSSWQPMAIGLFVVGLFLTAISYIERSPLVIIGALLAGYSSILSFASGNKLGLNETVAILLFMSQSVYWALVISRLDTVRARYVRIFQITVAAMIPIVGVGYAGRPIFAVSLALFGFILSKEVWKRGQSAREIALFTVHLSGLWLLYTLGVRELQVYTQSTALLIAGFASWRRRLQDSPSIINQYLWTSVLMFSLPLVYQALTSGNPAYSYLLLVEHTALIIVSIILKRATFAWWGIAVTVAAVLYQLRKLRYAALAFLGIFIISLAVYFLLKYNKPDVK